MSSSQLSQFLDGFETLILFQPFNCQDFHCFWTVWFFGQFIRGQSVTQRSMGREAPRYPPQCPGP